MLSHLNPSHVQHDGANHLDREMIGNPLRGARLERADRFRQHTLHPADRPDFKLVMLEPEPAHGG